MVLLVVWVCPNHSGGDDNARAKVINGKHRYGRKNGALTTHAHTGQISPSPGFSSRIEQLFA